MNSVIQELIMELYKEDNKLFEKNKSSIIRLSRYVGINYNEAEGFYRDPIAQPTFDVLRDILFGVLDILKKEDRQVFSFMNDDVNYLNIKRKIMVKNDLSDKEEYFIILLVNKLKEFDEKDIIIYLKYLTLINRIISNNIKKLKQSEFNCWIVSMSDVSFMADLTLSRTKKPQDTYVTLLNLNKLNTEFTNHGIKPFSPKSLDLIKETQKSSTNMELKIQEFKELLKRNAEEPEYQLFLEKYPHFIEPRVVSCFAKKSFGGERYPDFFLMLENQQYIVVEIEKSGTPLFTRGGDPTHEFTHARQQIRDYISWAIEEKEFLRKRGCPGLSDQNLSGVLIIGNGRNLTIENKKKLQNINAEILGKYVIKTFDQILDENEIIFKNLHY
ncbi:hypothetical protein ES703_28981 [subsurface metagenome]